MAIWLCTLLMLLLRGASTQCPVHPPHILVLTPQRAILNRPLKLSLTDKVLYESQEGDPLRGENPLKVHIMITSLNPSLNF